MSYIEILILRRLRSGPAHGYELRKRVEQTTGFVLHNNSLYPALRRFEEAGAVTKAAEPQEGRLLRLVYTLTAVGRELLHDMLADLPAEQAADPSEFLARLGQFAEIDPAEIGPRCLPRAPGPCATSWRTTGRCWRSGGGSR